MKNFIKLLVGSVLLCKSFCFAQGFYGGVDWIYWKARLDGLHAGDLIDDHPNLILKTVDVSGIEVDPTYKSGVRAHLGYDTPFNFDFSFSYLPIKSNPDAVFGRGDISPSHQEYIFLDIVNFPLLMAFQAPISQMIVVPNLTEEWQGNFYIFDATASWNFLICNQLALIPYSGFRGAWSRQTLTLSSNLVVPAINGANAASIHTQQKFQGYGLQAGCCWEWNWSYGFSLFGHAGGSLLYGQYNVDTYVYNYLNGVTVFIGTDFGRVETLTPTVEYDIGLRYTTCFCTHPIGIHLSWEEQLYFDFNQMSFKGGNFSMRGLTLGCDFGF